jgi:hypothetical protein
LNLNAPVCLGITDQQARFVLAFTECNEKALLARAQELSTGDNNIYKKMEPDISCKASFLLHVLSQRKSTFF